MLMGSNPALLESVLNDPSLRKTNFVLLHGGAGPFTKYVNYLLMKPNVYADFSEQTWLISTRRLSETFVTSWSGIRKKSCSGPISIPTPRKSTGKKLAGRPRNPRREALAIALTE